MKFCLPLAIVFAVCCLTRSTFDSTFLLRWAPLRLRSPYLTFINHFYAPSWRTRNPLTKEEESLRHLRLPRDVPFAVVCGACFPRSVVATNLTVSVSGHAFESVPKMHNGGRTEYRVGGQECLMTYMITSAIQRDGTITCTLNRGTRKRTEVISFDVVDVTIDRPPEELELGNEEPEVTLQCPTPDETPSLSNPLVYVWHEEGAEEEEGTVGSPILEMKQTLTLQRPKNTRHIVCSVYNIGRPTKVYRARYQVSGSLALAKQEYQVSFDLVTKEDAAQSLPPPGGKLSNAVLGIIITTAVVCVLLVVLGVHHFTTAGRQR